MYKYIELLAVHRSIVINNMNEIQSRNIDARLSARMACRSGQLKNALQIDRNSTVRALYLTWHS